MVFQRLVDHNQRLDKHSIDLSNITVIPIRDHHAGQQLAKGESGVSHMKSDVISGLKRIGNTGRLYITLAQNFSKTKTVSVF